jgi:hypothetical protein
VPTTPAALLIGKVQLGHPGPTRVLRVRDLLIASRARWLAVGTTQVKHFAAFCQWVFILLAHLPDHLVCAINGRTGELGDSGQVVSDLLSL